MEPIERFPVVSLPGSGEGEFALPLNEAGQVQQSQHGVVNLVNVRFHKGSLTTARQSRNRTARSVWNAWSLLPLSNRPHLTTAPASWTHSIRFARQFVHIKDCVTHLDHTSIDHYIPKSADPTKAYEWSNFRLSRSRLNQRKANFRDVLDPCAVSNDWFVLDFFTFRMKPAPELPAGTDAKVRATISRLQLNTDPDYVNERIEVIRRHALDAITFPQVRARWPFIAHQMLVQGFETAHKPRLAAFFLRTPRGP
jgi:hypothetical protein